MEKHLQIIFLILLVVNISAQELSQLRVVGKGEFLPSELISKDNRDSNGEVCAAVVISTDLDGLSFQAYNGIVKTNSNPGRHFIFVSPTERVVEVFKSGYKPLKIILNDYGINLKSGQAWEMEVTSDKKIVSNYTGKGSFTLNSDPEGAKILIDGIPAFSATTPYNFIDWNAGVYEITMTKDEYYPLKCQIVIDKNGKTSQKEKLTPTFGYIYVGISEKDAKMKIGNKFYIINEYNKIPIGNYELVVSRDEYDSIAKHISVTSGDTIAFPSLSLAAKFGYIKVNCDIENSNILLGDRKLINAELTKVPLGKYFLNVSSEHYKSYRKEVDILSNKTQNINVELIPILGKISFVGLTSDDNGAELYLDDKYIGKLPIGEKELLEGKHKLLIKKEGTFDKAVELYINEGINSQKEISLDREREITINTEPQGAEVNLDGVYLGKTPIELKSTIGELNLSFSKEGYVGKDETIIIIPNSTDYSINLESKLIENSEPENNLYQYTPAGLNIISGSINYINSQSNFNLNMRVAAFSFFGLTLALIEYETFYFWNNMNDSWENVEATSLLGNVKFAVGSKLTDRTSVSIYAKAFHPFLASQKQSQDIAEGDLSSDVSYLSYGLSLNFILFPKTNGKLKTSIIKIVAGQKETVLRKAIYADGNWVDLSENKNAFFFIGVEVIWGFGYDFLQLW